MQKVQLKCPRPSPQHEAVVFFGLTLVEQLYDLTDDSFKAPALNTFSRTLELQSVAQANHSAGISKDALKPFIEELEWSISKDLSLTPQQRALCKVHIESINENLGEADRIARGVSGLRIILGEYFKNTILSIIKLIMEEPTKKQDLISLTSSFIIQAETHGFPRRHTYHVTQNAIIRHLRNDKSFEPEKIIKDFFSEFSPQRTTYDCIFLVEGGFSSFPKLLERLSLKSLDSAPLWENVSADKASFLASKKDTQCFLLVEKINSRSPAQAHQIAVEKLAEFSAIVGFYEHKLKFDRTSLSLVRDNSSNKTFRIHDTPDPMHCWVSHTVASEENMLSLMSATHGKQLTDSSANKLRRCIRLHRSALQSNSAENQLIDLWAGLEGLVSRPGRESLRIEFFSECLLPCLTLSYPEKLFVSAYRDLYRQNAPAKNRILSLSGNDSGFSKFIRVVLCDQHISLRNETIEDLKKSPLLMNKVWRLSQLFKNRSATQQTLRHHRQKVKWHLARIYHTRNSIMHTARALPYLPTIVENLHLYIDTLATSIQKIANISPERLTIEGALQYLSSWEKYRLHSITHQGTDNNAPLNDSDVWDVLFGENMALSPKPTEEPVTPEWRTSLPVNFANP